MFSWIFFSHLLLFSFLLLLLLLIFHYQKGYQPFCPHAHDIIFFKASQVFVFSSSVDIATHLLPSRTHDKWIMTIRVAHRSCAASRKWLAHDNDDDDDGCKGVRVFTVITLSSTCMHCLCLIILLQEDETLLSSLIFFIAFEMENLLSVKFTYFGSFFLFFLFFPHPVPAHTQKTTPEPASCYSHLMACPDWPLRNLRAAPSRKDALN